LKSKNTGQKATGGHGDYRIVFFSRKLQKEVIAIGHDGYRIALENEFESGVVSYIQTDGIVVSESGGSLSTKSIFVAALRGGRNRYFALVGSNSSAQNPSAVGPPYRIRGIAESIAEELVFVDRLYIESRRTYFDNLALCYPWLSSSKNTETDELERLVLGLVAQQRDSLTISLLATGIGLQIPLALPPILNCYAAGLITLELEASRLSPDTKIRLRQPAA